MSETKNAMDIDKICKELGIDQLNSGASTGAH